MAIIEYLDETHPEPPLLPHEPLGRARVRALALDIACEIHPLNNLRVLRYLVRDLKVDEDDKNRWYRHWVETGLEAVERQLAAQPAPRSATATRRRWPTAAWCRRSSTPSASSAGSTTCRTTMRVFEACMALPAFQRPQPSTARMPREPRGAAGGNARLADPRVAMPPRVGACMTTRAGGVSARAVRQHEPGPPVGDAPDAVRANRERFAEAMRRGRCSCGRCTATRVVRLDADSAAAPRRGADACVTTEPGVACTVLVADCLPVLLAAPHGARGRRGACGLARPGGGRARGARVDARVRGGAAASRADSCAWLGPCIGPRRLRGRRRRARGVRRRAARLRAAVASAASRAPTAQVAGRPGRPGARPAAARPACHASAAARWCTVQRPLTVLFVPARRRHRAHGRRGLDPQPLTPRRAPTAPRRRASAM